MTEAPLKTKLHLSLARECVKRACGFYRQAREDGWFLNQDQIDAIRDAGDDARREARTHIEAALWAHAHAASARVWPRIPERGVAA